MKSLSVKLGVIFVAIVFIFLFSISAFAGELDEPYSPTRKEWLEISIFKLIKDRTDSWRQRIGSVIWVVEKENTVFITLTSAMGQEQLTKDAEKRYIEIIKNDVEAFLNTRAWSRNLKVYVQFI